VNNIFNNKAIGELIRIVDAREQENNYLKAKLREDLYKSVDAEARALFAAGVTAGMLKCASGYNYIGVRTK